MARKLLAGVIGAVLVVGCLGAQAMPANDTTMTRYPAVNGFVHQGNYVADFVQGRLVNAEPRGAAVTATPVDEDRAARYAAQNAVLTIVFLAVVALALACFTAVSKVRARASRRAATPEDGWKETLSEMLEADLASLDSLAHGFGGR